MLRKADLMPHLEFFLSNEDVEHHKPHPEMYQKAITRLGLAANECLVVEDNPQGIKAAQESGAHLLEVTDPKDVYYDNIIERVREIEAGASAWSISLFPSPENPRSSKTSFFPNRFLRSMT